MDIPPEFRPLFRTSPVLDLIGPLSLVTARRVAAVVAVTIDGRHDPRIMEAADARRPWRRCRWS